MSCLVNVNANIQNMQFVRWNLKHVIQHILDNILIIKLIVFRCRGIVGVFILSC